MRSLIRCKSIPIVSVCPRRAGLYCKASLSKTAYNEEAELKAWILGHAKGMPANLDVSPSGHGMVCVEAVERGQALIRLPRTVLMTAETARQSPEYGGIICDAEGLTEWQTLIAHLLCERALGPGSRWAPYIAILPDQSQHPLLWGEEQMAWLDGSPMQAVLRDRQSQVTEDAEALQIAMPEDILGQKAASLFSEANVKWAAATLLSRAFSLDMAEDQDPIEGDMSSFGSWQDHVPDVLALVPWADMMRHSSEAGQESCLRFCFELNAVTSTAHTDYLSGSEVFISFGPNLSPTELLMDYGFVDDANRNYKIEIETKAVASPASSRSRALLGALAGVQGSASNLALGPRGPDVTSLAWVRAALATDAELVRAGWRVKATEKDVELACRVLGTLGDPISEKNETKVLEAFSAALLNQIARYPTSLEQDQAEERNPGTPRLRVHVLRALMSEKRSLQGALDVIGDWSKRLQGGQPAADLYTDWDWGYEEDTTWDDEDEAEGA